MADSTSIYATTKALCHRDRISQLRREEQPYPVHVQLVISDFCNHDCRYCAYRMSGYTSNQLFQEEAGQTRRARNPRRMIPKEKCFEILDDCKEMGLKAIQFTGGGEPTIHPDFCEIVAYALSLDFDVSLVTNGSMLVDKEKRKLIEKMVWTRISIDSSNPEHYCKERRVGLGAWRRLEKGVQLLVKEIQEENLPISLGAGFVVTPRNWTQMQDAVSLYKEWGFHNVRLGLMFNCEGSKLYESFHDDMLYLALKTKENLEDDSFKVINRTAEKLGELEQGSPEYERCRYMNFTTYIGGDQNVYACCVVSYNRRGLVGNIRDQHFKELWESEGKKRIFTGFDARGCVRCQFNEINRAINALLENGQHLSVNHLHVPPHVNFV